MEAVRARLLLDFAPPPRRGKVIATAVVASSIFHLVLFTLLGGSQVRPDLPRDSSIDMEIVEVAPPPPPPPPEPEVIPEPVAAPKPRLVEKPPEPVDEPPPPPNQEPPPEPPAKPPPIRVGISLQSTTEGGSVAMGTGNTLYGKADKVAGDPSGARPYAAEETKKAPFVPSSRVTSLPSLRREAPKVYPQVARNAGIEGTVIARIKIDENGKVVAVKIVEGPGYGLEEAARKALFQFLFEPAKVDGMPVATEIAYEYTFLLD